MAQPEEYVPSAEVMQRAQRLERSGARLVFTGNAQHADDSCPLGEPMAAPLSTHPWGLRPPAAAAFIGEDGETVPFLPAPELERRVDELVARYPELAFLDSLEVAVLWKAVGGKAKGRPVLGKCTRPSGLLAYFSRADFVIWIAADHVRERNGVGLTEQQVEALLYHELSHIGWDDEADKPIVVGHDLEEFRKVVERYGLWLEDVRTMDSTFQQLRLKVGDAA